MLLKSMAAGKVTKMLRQICDQEGQLRVATFLPTCLAYAF